MGDTVWSWHFLAKDGSGVSANAASEAEARRLAYSMLQERVDAASEEDPGARWGELTCDAKTKVNEPGIAGSN